jgi:hypothetical protein
MSTIAWVVMLLLLGLVTGRVVGALTAFTRGPAVYDLLAGGIGAVTVGVLLRFAGPLGFRAPLVTLLAGVDAALLAAWLMRIVTWRSEPTLERPDDASQYADAGRQRHDVMTTGEATVLLTQGRLVAPRNI